MRVQSISTNNTMFRAKMEQIVFDKDYIYDQKLNDTVSTFNKVTENEYPDTKISVSNIKPFGYSDGYLYFEISGNKSKGHGLSGTFDGRAFDNIMNLDNNERVNKFRKIVEKYNESKIISDVYEDQQNFVNKYNLKNEELYNLSLVSKNVASRDLKKRLEPEKILDSIHWHEAFR